MRSALLTVGLAVAGVVVTVGGLIALLLHEGLVTENQAAALGPLIADGIWVACGLVAWWQRPNNAIGPLVATLGLVDLFHALPWDAALPFTVVSVVSAFVIPLLVHVFLAFPSGRLTTGPELALVRFGYVAAAILGPVSALAYDPAANGCSNCPPNLLFVEGARGWAAPLDVVFSVVVFAFLAAATALVMARWRRASGAMSRALGPVLLAGLLEMALLCSGVALEAIGLEDLASIVDNVGGTVYAAIPLVVAFGLLRTRLHRGAIADLLVQLESNPDVPGLHHELARTLGDPSLELGFWLPAEARYVMADGGHFDPSVSSGDRTATVIEHDGERLAVLVHDSYLDAALVQAVGAAASMALANGRLQAALRTQLAVVRASRSRIVAAGDIERRRLERDLHDGAQQRLLGVRLALQLARSQLADGNTVGASDVLVEADTAVVEAITELRALARGIHPPILTEEGLGPALAALAGRAPLPIELSVDGGRLPPAVEATCYFVAAEATANVVKHASANRARISIRVADGMATLVVTDDGVGGADADGAGLRGLRDRVEAVDGRFAVAAQPSGGTRVTAAIPCA